MPKDANTWTEAADICGLRTLHVSLRTLISGLRSLIGGLRTHNS